MSRVLVTGGAGFIGSHLVDALVAAGHDVVVLDDLSTGDERNLAQSLTNIEFIHGSIVDADVVTQAVKGCSAVFHLAAVSSVALAQEQPLAVHEVNATGTLQVFLAARDAGARVVFSSSAAVYGDDPALPTAEDQVPRPISLYGAQKLLGEGYLRALDLDAVALRYFNVFGPRQHPKSPYSGVISIFMDRFVEGQPITIHGDGEQTRDFVFVEDVVRANLAALGRQEPGLLVCNIGRGQQTSVIELAKAIRSLTDSKSEVSHGPAREGDIRHSLSNPSLAQNALGWQAQVSLQDGLGQTVAYYRK